MSRGRLKAAAAVVVIGIGAGVFSAATDVTVVVIGLSVAGMTLHQVWGRLGPGPLSPTKIVVVTLGLMSVVGPIAYVATARYQGMISVLDVDLPTLMRTSQALSLASAAFAMGSMASLMFASSASRRPATRSVETTTWAGIRNRSPAVDVGLALVLLLVPVVLLLAGSGGGARDFLERSQYIASEAVSGYDRASNQPIYGLGLQAATVSVVFLGYLFSRSRFRYVKLASAASAAVLFAVFLALGSRRLSLVAILFAVGAFAADPLSRPSRRLLMVGGAVSLSMIGVAWFLRGLESHGLVPYALALASTNPFEVLEFDALLANIGTIFGQIAATSQVQPRLSDAVFWISVNPLPGALVGWYDVAPDLRLTPWMPYPAIGQLMNHGLQWLLGFSLVGGSMLGFIDAKIVKGIIRGSSWLSLAASGLAGLLTLYLLQYNLRSASRILWYLLLFYMVTVVARSFKPRVHHDLGTVRRASVESAGSRPER